MTATIAVAGRRGASKTNPAGLFIRRRSLGLAPPHDDRADAVQHLRAHERRATGMALAVLQIHERTFYHQPGLVMRAKGDDPVLADTAAAVAACEVERVGPTSTLNGIAAP